MNINIQFPSFALKQGYVIQVNINNNIYINTKSGTRHELNYHMHWRAMNQQIV